MNVRTPFLAAPTPECVCVCMCGGERRRYLIIGKMIKYPPRQTNGGTEQVAFSMNVAEGRSM